ncbi:hypothetical protein Tco_1265863 [Tanacetum coccineum]
MLSDIEDSHGPSDAMHNPSQPLKVGKTLFQNSRRFTHFYQLSHSELVDIEKVALSSSLRSLKSKCTIESRAKKRSSINLIRTLVKLNLLNTSVGNPVKEILLKLNLPDHRILKDECEDKEFQRSFCHSHTKRLSRSDEVLKLKNFKKDATLKLFKSTDQERYEHVGPEVTSSQDGKVYYAWLMISRCSRSHIHIKVKVKGMCYSLKVKITTTYSQEEEKKEIQVCEHKNEDST